MTQRAVGEVRLRTAEGERVIEVTPHNLYERSLACFDAAVRGAGQPAATGADGVRSLATALAVLEAVRTGQRTRVAST
jgi:1,5-anhydro-D-fructose reductase (1,5-anhydro-D-mannitol-forming)